MRDVTFDESLFYDPKEPNLRALIPKHVEQIIGAITITEIAESTAWMTQLDDLSSSFQQLLDNGKEPSPVASPPQTPGSKGKGPAAPEHAPMAPEPTLEPTSLFPSKLGAPVSCFGSSQPPTAASNPEEQPETQQQLGLSTACWFNEISADFDPSNIASRSTRYKRRRVYLPDLERAEELPGLRAAFLAGLHQRPGSQH
jgi:hypothetical protein